MPKPEIYMSHTFGMGFWIDDRGNFMSCPAFENGSFDVENAICVDEWDDFSVYTLNHMRHLAHVVRICTMKREFCKHRLLCRKIRENQLCNRLIQKVYESTT